MVCFWCSIFERVSVDFLSDIDDVNSARSAPFSVTQTGSFYVKHEIGFVAVSVYELKRVTVRVLGGFLFAK